MVRLTPPTLKFYVLDDDGKPQEASFEEVARIFQATTFDQYQEQTAKTAIYGDQIFTILNGISSDDPHKIVNLAKLLNVSYVSNGLGEVGEVQGKIKKIIRDSGGVITDEHRKKIAGELGDVMWYLSQMCTEFGLSMSDVAAANLAKLASRKERGTLQGSGDER